MQHRLHSQRQHPDCGDVKTRTETPTETGDVKHQGGKSSRLEVWLDDKLLCHLTKIYKSQTPTAKVVKLVSDVYISGEHNTMKTRLFHLNPLKPPSLRFLR